jgi:hypothetical protein
MFAVDISDYACVSLRGFSSIHRRQWEQNPDAKFVIILGFRRRSGCLSIRYGRFFKAESLFGRSSDLRVKPIYGDTLRVLLRSDSMTIPALIFKRSYNLFDHPIPLRAVRRDELPSRSVALNHPGVAHRCGDQTVFGPHEERPIDAPGTAEARDQRSAIPTNAVGPHAASRSLRTQQFPGVGVEENHQTPQFITNRMRD